VKGDSSLKTYSKIERMSVAAATELLLTSERAASERKGPENFPVQIQPHVVFATELFPTRGLKLLHNPKRDCCKWRQARRWRFSQHSPQSQVDMLLRRDGGWHLQK
jgi:hypothetical protein